MPVSGRACCLCGRMVVLRGWIVALGVSRPACGKVCRLRRALHVVWMEIWRSWYVPGRCRLYCVLEICPCLAVQVASDGACTCACLRGLKERKKTGAGMNLRL